jgi:FlaA1/EpsC-like NDP-sugar epimerase
VNVIGSPGSVAPLFAEQIARGGPVTVTHREARRFFMTLEEVAVLLAEAVETGDAPGILAPNPGEPVLIAELARRMIAASGRDVPVVFTKPRPGDKLDEELVGARERCSGWTTRGLRRVASPAVDDLALRVGALEAAVDARDVAGLLRRVEELVPDYEPSVLLRDSACAVR